MLHLLNIKIIYQQVPVQACECIFLRLNALGCPHFLSLETAMRGYTGPLVQNFDYWAKFGIFQKPVLTSSKWLFW